MIERRQAVIVAMGVIVEAMIGKATANASQAVGESYSISDTTKPVSVTMDLGNFKNFSFQLNGEVINLTPEEIFKALKEGK